MVKLSSSVIYDVTAYIRRCNSGSDLGYGGRQILIRQHVSTVAALSLNLFYLSYFQRDSKAGRALYRIGPARFSPARIKRTSAHCFGTCQHRKPVTAEKHIKPFAWKQASDFRNVLLSVRPPLWSSG
jgi:hypothetical protein